MVSRRHFIQRAAAVGVALPGLQAIGGCERKIVDPATGLVVDPDGMLDLADGFSYTILSRTGNEMSDGLIEPGAHDGMACFPVAGEAGKCVLVRNHELDFDETGERGAFGEGFARAGRLDASRIYDFSGERPLMGGTTTVVVDMNAMRVERSHLSLAGTMRNCAGGPTPWGSWLTCEETNQRADGSIGKDHGYVFEVSSEAEGLVEPVPLTAMGRFVHEAAAVDPSTGIVYMTEDSGDGLFYRFLPNSPAGRLAQGGRLQALAVRGTSGAVMSNWPDAGASAVRLAPGESVEVEWITLEDVQAPNNDLRIRGRAAGAAIFSRGEGLAFAFEGRGRAVYFACTSGGAAKKGQIWKYIPAEAEGTRDEEAAPGRLELFVESTGEAHFDYADNIVASPGGDIVMCEDGDGDNYLRGVTQTGNVYSIGRNALPGQSEFCGACFSPDGSTMFVNIQNPGITLAIQGDWAALSARADVADA